jgi:hypothetical protein
VAKVVISVPRRYIPEFLQLYPETFRIFALHEDPDHRRPAGVIG